MTTNGIAVLEERAWIAFSISMVLGLISWIRRQYILNKPLLPLTYSKVYSLAFSLFSSGLYWISLISVQRGIILQIISGLIATIMSWYALTIIVNEVMFVVKPKQIVSLVFYIINDTLTQVTTRLVFN